jgi:hypothetical protein
MQACRIMWSIIQHQSNRLMLMHPAPKIVPTVGEACLVVAICFGWFILISVEAVFKGFPTSESLSDASLFSLIVIECIFGTIALFILRSRGYSIRELLPSPTWSGSLSGVLLLVAALGGCWFVALFFTQTN